MLCGFCIVQDLAFWTLNCLVWPERSEAGYRSFAQRRLLEGCGAVCTVHASPSNVNCVFVGIDTDIGLIFP